MERSQSRAIQMVLDRLTALPLASGQRPRLILLLLNNSLKAGGINPQSMGMERVTLRCQGL